MVPELCHLFHIYIRSKESNMQNLQLRVNRELRNLHGVALLQKNEFSPKIANNGPITQQPMYSFLWLCNKHFWVQKAPAEKSISWYYKERISSWLNLHVLPNKFLKEPSSFYPGSLCIPSIDRLTQEALKQLARKELEHEQGHQKTLQIWGISVSSTIELYWVCQEQECC